MLDVAFEMSTPAAPDMWRRCLTMLLDGVRARDRPAMPGRVPVLNTLDDLVAVGKARRSRTADECRPRHGDPDLPEVMNVQPARA